MPSSPLSRALRDFPRASFLPSEVTEPGSPLVPIFLPGGRRLRPTAELVALFQAVHPRPSESVVLVGPGLWETALAAGLYRNVTVLERDFARANELREAVAERGLLGVAVVERDAALGLPDRPAVDTVMVLASEFGLTPVFEKMVLPGGRVGLITTAPSSGTTMVFGLRSVDGELVEESTTPLDARRDVGDYLVAEELITPQVLAGLRQQAAARGMPLETVILREGAVEETALFHGVSVFYGIRFASSDDLIPLLDPRIVARLPRPFLRYHRIVPIWEADGIVHLATTNPRVSTYELSRVLGRETVELLLVTPSDFMRLWTTLELGVTGELDGERDVLGRVAFGAQRGQPGRGFGGAARVAAVRRRRVRVVDAGVGRFLRRGVGSRSFHGRMLGASDCQGTGHQGADG